ncbi:hypothetical protein D049_0736A, partial [Vibrio parahaemolyticus VPTS-2010]
MSQSSWLPT